jgi:hypothetical protein
MPASMRPAAATTPAGSSLSQRGKGREWIGEDYNMKQEFCDNLAKVVPAAWKTHIRRIPAVEAFLNTAERRRMEEEYRQRRDKYHHMATERGLVYDEGTVTALIRARLRDRGYRPIPRRIGELHTFAVIPMVSWHRHLLSDLRELGPLTLFDYTSLGYRVEDMLRADGNTLCLRRELMELLWAKLCETHARRPVDWVFCYAGGKDNSSALYRRITDELGIPTVNISLDDKHCWTGPWMGDHHSGAVGLTAAFDLFVTSSRVSCEWHMVEGGRPIYMPEGFDASYYRPRSGPRDIPVSFIGAAYGFRPAVIEFLRTRGISVEAFGQGWPGNGYAEDPVGIYNRSIINLGMGGILGSEELTSVKGRDFEVTGTGGAVYVTSYNPDLARHFSVGEEILCYSTRDEMLEIVRDCLARPDECREIARKARERCVSEHRWLHRYMKMLEILGIFPEEPAGTAGRGARSGEISDHPVGTADRGRAA